MEIELIEIPIRKVKIALFVYAYKCLDYQSNYGIYNHIFEGLYYLLYSKNPVITCERRTKRASGPIHFPSSTRHVTRISQSVDEPQGNRSSSRKKSGEHLTCDADTPQEGSCGRMQGREGHDSLPSKLYKRKGKSLDDSPEYIKINAVNAIL